VMRILKTLSKIKIGKIIHCNIYNILISYNLLPKKKFPNYIEIKYKLLITIKDVKKLITEMKKLRLYFKKMIYM